MTQKFSMPLATYERSRQLNEEDWLALEEAGDIKLNAAQRKALQENFDELFSFVAFDKAKIRYSEVRPICDRWLARLAKTPDHIPWAEHEDDEAVCAAKRAVILEWARLEHSGRKKKQTAADAVRSVLAQVRKSDHGRRDGTRRLIVGFVAVVIDEFIAAGGRGGPYAVHAFNFAAAALQLAGHGVFVSEKGDALVKIIKEGHTQRPGI